MATQPTTKVIGPSSQVPTKTRYWVVVFAVTLAILSYIDRVCISQAAPVISQDLGLSKQQMGYVFSAFAIAYAAFEIPGGWMGDRMGPRSVLMRIVMWWSFFTAATGFMWNFTSLWIARFLFGAGEAGCFPNLTKAFANWLPQDERVRAQAIMWTFARWGGAFTPPLVVATFQIMSWRWAFVVFGALGVVWALFFYAWFRDSPAQHKDVNAAELARIGDAAAESAGGHGNVPWGKLTGSKTIWLLWIQYFLLSYPWYFYITWLPTFLKERFPLLDDSSRAWLAVLPLLFGGMGALFCGFISARVVAWTGSVRAARRLLATTGFLGAAIMIVLCLRMQDPVPLMLFMGLASFCNDLVMPGAWATCMDVGGKFSGTVAGSMNMMGNFAGFVGPAAVPWMLKEFGGDWTVVLYSMAGAYLLGTLCWPFIDPVTPLEKKPGSLTDSRASAGH